MNVYEIKNKVATKHSHYFVCVCEHVYVGGRGGGMYFEILLMNAIDDISNSVRQNHSHTLHIPVKCTLLFGTEPSWYNSLIVRHSGINIYSTTGKERL